MSRSPPRPPTDLLLKLFETAWQEDLADDPLSATAVGDPRFNDRLPDMSIVAIDARQKKNYPRLASLRKIKREKLDKADQLNYDLFERDIKTRIGEYQFKPWMFSVRPGEGPQMLAETAEYAPFKTVKDYDNWIARINASGAYIDQWVLLLTQGVTEKLTQPRLIIEKVLDQMKGPLTADAEANPFYAPFKKMPDSIPAAEKARLQAAGKAAIQTVAIPAYQRFDKFFREVYLPGARDTVGIYDIPGGEQYYRNRINYFTTVENMDAATHPQPGPRGSEAHPRRDGEDARGHQLPRHARSVPGFHPQRSALLLQDAGRADGRVREGRARHRAAIAETLRPSAEDAVRHPRDSRRDRADDDDGLLPAAVTGRLAPRQLLRESLQARDAADVGSRGAHGARIRPGPPSADRTGSTSSRVCRNSAATRATRPSSRAGRCTARSSATSSACTRTTSRSSAS